MLSLNGFNSFVPLHHAATEWFYLLLHVTINAQFLQRTYFTEHSPGSKACSVPAVQETLRILLELEVHYSAHNSPPPVLVFSPVIPVYTSPSYFFMIYFNIIPSTDRFSKSLFPFRSTSKKLHEFLFALFRVSCIGHFVLPDFIILKIFW